VVDDDPKAVELIAVRILGLASTVLRAYGGQEAIDTARREAARPHRARPDDAGRERLRRGGGASPAAGDSGDPDPDRDRQGVTSEDRNQLNGFVTAIMSKTEFDRDRFVDRSPAGRLGPPRGELTCPRSSSSKTTPPT
jgi:hypothetical protein